jgi:hypothetical protein
MTLARLVFLFLLLLCAYTLIVKEINGIMAGDLTTLKEEKNSCLSFLNVYPQAL